jgi:hypothetical protein
MIISPLVDEASGSGFDLIFLAEFPLKRSTHNEIGPLYQFCFNKTF